MKKATLGWVAWGAIALLTACPGPASKPGGTSTARAKPSPKGAVASPAPTPASGTLARSDASPSTLPSARPTAAPAASPSPLAGPDPTVDRTKELPTRPGLAGIVPAGALTVSTFSGGTQAAPNPTGFVAGDAAASRYGTIRGVAIDGAGNLLLCEGLDPPLTPDAPEKAVHGLVRKVRPDGSSLVLGGDHPGPPRPDFFLANDTLAATRFNGPLAPLVPAAGGLAILSNDLFTVRQIGLDGRIAPVAWIAVVESGLPSPYLNVRSGVSYHHNPQGLAQDVTGNWYIGDAGDHVIRKLTPDGRTTLFAGGTGTTPNPKGYLNGPAAQARFNAPWGLAFDSKGDLYVAERDNGTIRRITPAGMVSTFAGPPGQGLGYRNGPAATAEFASPTGLAIDATDTVFVADLANHAIRRITSAGEVSTVAGGDDERLAGPGFRNGPAAQAQFDQPVALAIGSGGELYVADQGNHLIRKVR